MKSILAVFLLIIQLLTCVVVSAQQSLVSRSTISAKKADYYRRLADKYLNFYDKPDSAFFFYSKYIHSKKYVIAKDYLSYAQCYLKKNDADRFYAYVDKAILKGANEQLIENWFSTEPNYSERVKASILNRYASLHRSFLSSIDTNLYRDLLKIMEVDQEPRNLEPTNPEETKARILMIKEADSINYLHIVDLFNQHKFPGYHQVGQDAELFVPLLMHVTDELASDVKWNYVLKQLKREVRAGNITPLSVAMIGDRHSMNNAKCFYYGLFTYDNLPLCNCKEVDKYRKEVALPSLAKERYYLLGRMQLPDCYKEY